MASPWKILVVEDEELVRLILAESLDDQGFVVVAVPSGDEAVVLLDDPDRFDAVVTDVHMPGDKDGIAVGQYVRQHHQDVPVIYVTGRPDALNALGRLSRKEAVLRKPYKPSQVAAKLHEMLVVGA
jgi:CheY-like chemotaxis protein